MFFKQLHRWCLILCLLGLGCSFAPAYSHEDKIVAIVNDDVITQSEVQKRVDEQKKQMMQANIALSSEKELRQKVLNDLIDRSIILQIAKRNNFKVSDKEIDAAVADVAKRNHATVAQLQQELQKIGMSLKGYRKNIAEELTIHRIQQQAVGGKVTVSDQEIASYMNKAKTLSAAASTRIYHIADILLPIADSASDQEKQDAKKAISQVIDKLRQGEAPSDIAQTTKVNGKALEANDLGMRKLSDLPSVFVSPVANLKSGEVAGPISAPNGLHVIKVLEIKDLGGAKAASFTQEDARQMAFQHKFEEALKPWMQQLRSTAYIKIMDED